MPCYLFTFHGYGTWLPDREQGYVERGRGLLPANGPLARVYHKNAAEDAVLFKAAEQQAVIESVLDARPHQSFRAHYVATEPTHVHVLISWTDDRDWTYVRKSVRTSIVRNLNAAFARRRWLAEGGSRRRVKDRSHFEHLIVTYLPAHRGWKWSEDSGLFRNATSDASSRSAPKKEKP